MAVAAGSSVMVATPTRPIHVRVDGRDGAPWLVFSNSHATNLSMWDDPVAALSSEFHILRYDQRGHGQTPPLDGPCRLDDLTEDLRMVMDACGIVQATLLGASMGAVTVLRAAARWPGRVSGVVAADGQWRSPPNAAALWQGRIDTVLRSGIAAIARPTVERWFRPGFEAVDPQRFSAMVGMIAGTSVAGYVGCAQALQSYDFSADYADLAVPVLYIVGAEDGALPATMRTMAENTPGARLTVIPDAGHLPNLEQPAAFLSAIVPFLRNCVRNRRHSPESRVPPTCRGSQDPATTR